MEVLERQIKQILEQTREEIRQNMQSKRINASGRTSASLRVEESDKALKLVGGMTGTHSVDGFEAFDTAPIPTLEFGREGGRVPRGFYHLIRQWSREKGLQFSSEQERNTFAYFVSKKIAREGTRRHTNHEDVYSTPVEKAKEQIKDAASRWLTDVVKVEVKGLQGAFTSR